MDNQHQDGNRVNFESSTISQQLYEIKGLLHVFLKRVDNLEHTIQWTIICAAIFATVALVVLIKSL